MEKIWVSKQCSTELILMGTCLGIQNTSRNNKNNNKNIHTLKIKHGLKFPLIEMKAWENDNIMNVIYLHLFVSSYDKFNTKLLS